MSSPVDVVSFSAHLMREDFDLASLAKPVYSIEANTACVVAEQILLEADLTSAVVVDEAGRVGLLARSRFLQELSGRLGYGRALLARTPVGELTDWDCLVVDAETPVTDAAYQAISRDPATRYDDVLVRLDTSMGMISTAQLVEAIAGVLATRSLRDQLTGLANRDLLFHHLRQLCTGATTVHHVVVIYIDLDGFKRVNDTLGHAVGDRLLVSAAARLQAAARPEDMVARVGGDEFVVVAAVRAPLSTDPESFARDIGHRYLEALSAGDPHDDPAASCDASAGVAMARIGDADPDTLLREADMAMYVAKQSTGLRLHVESDVKSLRPESSATLLRGALEEGWVTPYFQPIVSVTTGQIVSFEALARIRHPHNGILAPTAFLPDAPTGLSRQLDSAVLLAAARALHELENRTDTRYSGFLNVNLSPATLVRPDLAAHVLALLAETGLPPRRLRVELPEVADLPTVQQATGQLQLLRDAGVAVTLDDVGAGSSSLRHISRLAVDGIKIDRSFVAGIGTDDRDLAVVRTLVDLGAGLGLSVTAEGVETHEQLATLRELGCSYAQGYALGRPAPLEFWADSLTAS